MSASGVYRMGRIGRTGEGSFSKRGKEQFDPPNITHHK